MMSSSGNVVPIKDQERLRHPEKAHRPDNPVQQRKPEWIRVKAPTSPEYHETRALMRRYPTT